ncbi:MAG: glutathione peroxidase [Saprospiraceae bacterium]|nr:glutathione peroxidase [Saprospiraceae bacterium]
MNYYFQFITLSTLIGFLTGPFVKNTSISKPPLSDTGTQNLYDFKIKSLTDESIIDLSTYRGKKVIILNVASECGYTPQYANWQKFHEAHGDKVIVLGFPSNDFGAQEPGDNKQIASFCQKNYGVTFQLFDKITVKGENKHPLYKWLSTKELNGWNEKEPSWNFCKYVVNEKGELTNYFGSKVLPTDEVFLAAIK